MKRSGKAWENVSEKVEFLVSPSSTTTFGFTFPTLTKAVPYAARVATLSPKLYCGAAGFPAATVALVLPEVLRKYFSRHGGVPSSFKARAQSSCDNGFPCIFGASAKKETPPPFHVLAMIATGCLLSAIAASNAV